MAQRKDFLSKDANTKLSNLLKVNESLRHQLEERNHECALLEDKISNLSSQVAASNNVKQSRDDARGSAGDPAAIAATKMRKVVGRRHLVDTARSQAEEIDFLRQELDKMRQRTFPSFIRATRKRISGIDPEG